MATSVSDRLAAIAPAMSGFLPFHEGSVIEPTKPSDDWHVDPVVKEAAKVSAEASAEKELHTTKKNAKRKPAAHSDGKASIIGASFNLSNAIIGAGVGGMPYALYEAGFYSGLLLMVMVALCSDYTVRLLIRLGKQVNKHYYEQLVQSQFGRAGYIAVCAAMGIFAYGAMVAYLIGIGDTMSIVVSHWGGIDLHASPWVKRFVLTALAIGAVLPLALLKDMAKLSKTSFVSLMSVVFIIGVVVANAAGAIAADTLLPTTPAQRELKFIDTKFFPAIGIISFAFVCHHACFIVYNTLRDNTDARWAKTVHLSIGVALSVMMSLAIAAYLTFRGIMTSSFLTNYSYTDEVVNVMRCMFAIAQTLTYPLELFVVRHAVHALFFADQKRFTDKQHYMVTLVLWSSSLAIALSVTDLGVVLELTGGVSAVFIGFVLPPLLHFKMGEFSPFLWRNPVGKRWAATKELLPSIYIMCFGIMAMTLTIYTIAQEMILGEAHGPHDIYANGGDGISDTYDQMANQTAASTTGQRMML